MERQALEERIASFPWWYYRFEFDGGVRTPVLSPDTVNRAEQLRGYMFEPLLSVLGGSLRGRRVLDLGCNAGLWSLRAIEAGAEFVLGVDGLQMAIDQASFVFETLGVEPSRYRFECADVFARSFDERFDVVLCLDFMDQISKPVELFELIAGVGAETILIETSLSPAPDSCFEVCHLDDPLWTPNELMVLVPTREAVIELADEFGYGCVPLAHAMSDYTGLGDYPRGRRLAFICRRGSPPAGLAVAPPHRERSWLVETAGAGWRRLRGRAHR